MTLLKMPLADKSLNIYSVVIVAAVAASPVVSFLTVVTVVTFLVIMKQNNYNYSKNDKYHSKERCIAVEGFNFFGDVVAAAVAASPVFANLTEVTSVVIAGKTETKQYQQQQQQQLPN